MDSKYETCAHCGGMRYEHEGYTGPSRDRHCPAFAIKCENCDGKGYLPEVMPKRSIYGDVH